MRQETAHERTAIDFTEFDKAIEGAGVFTHVEDAMWVTDKAHQLIKANRSVSTDMQSLEKLQEQLNTAKKALTEIDKMANSGDITWNKDIKAVTNSALAALEGSGDE